MSRMLWIYIFILFHSAYFYLFALLTLQTLTNAILIPVKTTENVKILLEVITACAHVDSWEQTVAQVILLSFMPYIKLIMCFNERVSSLLQ